MRTRGDMVMKDGRRLSNVTIMDTTRRLKRAYRQHRAAEEAGTKRHAPSLRGFVDMVLHGNDESLKAAAAAWLDSKRFTDHPPRARPQSVINERAAKRTSRRKGSSGKKKPVEGESGGKKRR